MMLWIAILPAPVRCMLHGSRKSRQFELLVYSSLWISALLMLQLRPVWAESQDPLVQLYHDAVKEEQSADYDTAIRLYRKIVALRPDLAEAYANLGNLQYVQ